MKLGRRAWTRRKPPRMGLAIASIGLRTCRSFNVQSSPLARVRGAPSLRRISDASALAYGAGRFESLFRRPMSLSPWKLPVLKQLRQCGWLNEKLRLGFGPYWGMFPSRGEAEQFLRPDRRASPDDDELAEMNADIFSTVHPFDWPMLFFLGQMQKRERLKTITDFGGHVGVKYHAYKTQMAFPPDFLWQVVDIPAVCKAGRRRQGDDKTNLVYHENLKDTAPCDVLICSGVVQYLDHSLSDVIKRLPQRAGMVLLNKVAVTEGPAFYTLESLGFVRVPYLVTTIPALDAIREEHGYRLLARWEIPDRVFTIAHQRGHRNMRMIGEAWSADPV
ncbi:MAG: methyltransferase, TIGR04325 family [Caulobacterales bacterium]